LIKTIDFKEKTVNLQKTEKVMKKLDNV